MRARRSDLTSALVNLIVNGCEAMSAGGRLTVRTGSSSDAAWVEVEDDGPGIPPEIRAHVLDPFFTTKEHGTGLRLAMVATFMQQSGGAVEIASAVPTGTRVRLRFPAAAPSA